MSADERRGEIIAVTLPLLREHGVNVTTSQIAQAAGIAEGTIFRVFEDKRQLLQTALAEAISADAEVTRIDDIALNQPLDERLTTALQALSDYQDRLWSLMHVVRESGWHVEHSEHSELVTFRIDHHHHLKPDPRQQMERIALAMARLFEPDAASLCLDPRSAARMLLGLAFTNRMREQGMGQETEPAQLVDLFLHGALRQSK